MSSFFRFLSGCGGLLINKSGYIKSPNYPEHYGNNENCFWMIKVNENFLLHHCNIQSNFYSS